MAEFYVSPYVDNLALPNYKTQNYDTTLEIQLLQKKQSDYNTVLQRMSNLQSTALNISMLNLKGKEKLDQYNNEINEMLSQDLGDLSDPQVQAQIANTFNKISNDTDLKQRSKLSKHYQTQLDNIERMRSSKDPTKSGYNSVNETVFRKWEGGLEDFMVANDITGFNTKAQSYTPYKDIDQKLVNLTKLLHAEESTTLSPASTGYTLLESEQGVDKNRIRTLLQSSLDQDELSQMEILSKYRILQQGQDTGLLYDSYDNWIKTENQYTKNQLEKAKAYIEQFNPKNIDPKLSKEERAAKEAQYVALQQQYSEQEQELNRKIAQQTVNTLSKEEWLKKSPSEILPYVNQMTVESYVNGISESLKWKNEVKKVGTDEAYFADRRLNVMEERLNWDKQMDNAKLNLEYEKLKTQSIKDAKDAKEKDPSYATPIDIFKSPETIISSWDNFTSLAKEFKNKTAPIISSKDQNGNALIDPKNLTNDQWLNENQSNYEVQLWNAYKAKHYDTAFTDTDRRKPNINGFIAFKTQVENGDHKNDPAIQTVYSALKHDQQIADWLTETSNEVAGVVNNQTKVQDVTNGVHSLGDYARQHGWNGQGEMVFGIRDGQGYKSMTWSEVKKEYNKVINSGTGTTQGGGPLASTIGQPNYASSILQNDPDFFQLVGKAVAQEAQSTKMIQDIYASKMPQIFQGKQMVALDDKTRTQSIGYINSAIKLSSGSAPVSIDPTQVTNVSVPFGVGEYGGFSISEKEAERLKNNGAKIVTVGGVEEEPKPNVWYKVPMQPVAQYDILYNELFEKKGVIEENISGHKVRLTSIPNNSNYLYLYIDGSAPRSVPKRDINLILGEVKQGIQMLSQATQPPSK